MTQRGVKKSSPKHPNASPGGLVVNSSLSSLPRRGGRDESTRPESGESQGIPPGVDPGLTRRRWEATHGGRTLIAYADDADTASEALRGAFDLPDGLLIVIRLAEPLDPAGGYEDNR